jgi:hypothetical protein
MYFLPREIKKKVGFITIRPEQIVEKILYITFFLPSLRPLSKPPTKTFILLVQSQPRVPRPVLLA